jgi:mitogen-activated protein kinase organizer 1
MFWKHAFFVYFCTLRQLYESVKFVKFSEFPHEMEQEFKLNSKLDCQQGAVRAVRYNIDGDYIITSGSNKTIRLWTSTSKELNGGNRCPKLLNNYSGHGNEVLDARGSCDNGQILSCGLDRAVLLWDVGSGKILR